MNLKFVRLRGYHPRYNPPGNAERYRTAKQPVNKWQSADGLSKPDADAWLAEGGWLGLVVPEGFIVVDVDEDATGRLIREALGERRMGTIKTPRGWQFIFADSGLVPHQSSGFLTACGASVDYRLSNKGYIVYPFPGAVIEGQDEEARRWENHPSAHEWNLDPMPLALKPIWPGSAGSFDIPIVEGQRDDTLFRHACRLRKAGIEGADLLAVLRFVNDAFCSPPLSDSTIDEKAISAQKYPVSEVIKIDRAWSQSPPREALPSPAPITGNTYDAADLMDAVLPPVDWVIEEILPEGLAILAGPPKMGKSWAVLSAAAQCATGGAFLSRYQAVDGGVLYLALEDNQRRMQGRLRAVSKAVRSNGLPRGKLTIAHDWPSASDGGVAMLEDWVGARGDTALVVIDTFQNMRGIERPGNAYQVDYAALSAYKKLADSCKLALVLVHHFRKGAAEDWMEMFSGSSGLTGAADTLLAWTGKRGSDVRTLSVTGRDIKAPVEIAVKFDPQQGLIALGDAQTYELKEAHRTVLKALSTNGPLNLQELAAQVGRDKSNLAGRVLPYLIEQGLVVKRGHGLYDASQRPNELDAAMIVDDPMTDQKGAGWWLDS